MSTEKEAKIYEPYLSQADIALQRFIHRIEMLKLTPQQQQTSIASAENARNVIKDLDRYVTSIITAR